MKAFDTDVLTLIATGNQATILKVALIPAVERSVSIVAAEQLLRGRLNTIRQAQMGKSKVSVDYAYGLLESTIADLRIVKILSHSPQAEALTQAWRKQNIKVGISDLRIAAICVIHGATLISRNRRDFDQIPGLSVEYW